MIGYALMSSARVIDSLKLLIKYSKMLLASAHISVTTMSIFSIGSKSPAVAKIARAVLYRSLFTASINNLHILTGHYQTNSPIELPMINP